MKAVNLEQLKKEVEYCLYTQQFTFDYEIENPDELIENGFLPDFCPPNDSAEGIIRIGLIDFKMSNARAICFELYMLGYSKEYIQFLLPWNKLESILNLHRVKQWYYNSVEDRLHFAQGKGNSLPLIIYNPEMLYSSLRPITNMVVFHNPNNKMENNNDNSYSFIPVTRYGFGKDKGIYYNGNKKYKGTFYYYEEESTTYLRYQKKAIFRNKREAYISLRREIIEMLKLEISTSPSSSTGDRVPLWEQDDQVGIQLENYLDACRETINLEQKDIMEKRYNILLGLETFLNIRQGFVLPWEKSYYDGEFDIMMTPIEMVTKRLTRNKLQDAEAIPDKDRKIHISQFCGLFGLEDIYDQALANFGNILNYDIIILTEMIGSHQIVTEVLDCRDREESFENLYR